MQIRCTYCQMMFAVNHEEMLAALEQMEEEKIKFYDAHCPKCRRANRIERLKLEFAYPDWRDDLKKMASATTGIQQVAVPGKTAVPEPKVETPVGVGRKKHIHKATTKVTPKDVKIMEEKPAPAKSVANPKGMPAAKTTRKPVTKPAPKKTNRPAPKPAGKATKKPAKKSAVGMKKK